MDKIMMTGRWEVSTWEWEDRDDREDGGNFRYVSCWRGESALMAIFELIKAKMAGFGCVKLEWRSRE